MKTSFKGSFLFVVVLLLAFSGIGFAAACVSTDTILSGTLSQGATLTSTFSCTENQYTFSNFEVVGASIPVTVADWTLSLGPATNATGLVVDLAYTSLPSGDDIDLTFQIAPGVNQVTLGAGPSVSVTELLCSTPAPTGICSPGPNLNTSPLAAVNGGSSSSAVTLAGTDYVFKDIAGGSNVTQDFAPEPVTFSLMGFGLLALGFAGRKRIRKD